MAGCEAHGLTFTSSTQCLKGGWSTGLPPFAWALSQSVRLPLTLPLRLPLRLPLPLHLIWPELWELTDLTGIAKLF